MNKFITGLGVFVGIVGLGLYKALVLSYYWGWFVTPFGVAQISVIHCYGLIALYSLMSYKMDNNDEPVNLKNMPRIMTAAYFIVSLAFGIGWIASNYM